MLSVEEKAACLKKGIFEGLDDETLASMAERMGETDLADGDSLFLKGEPGDEIYVIIEGNIEIHLGEHVIAVLGPGQLFGEMAVLGGGKRTASGRARGETKLLFLKEKAIKVLIQQIPDLAFAIFKILIERLEEANRLAMFLSGKSPVRGAVKIVGGELDGKQFKIYHESATLGRAMGSAASDSLRIAIPDDTEELLEKHALVNIEKGMVYIEPQDGAVSVNGAEIEDCMAVSRSDIVEMGGIKMRFAAKPGE